jgi:hypothetical protein
MILLLIFPAMALIFLVPLLLFRFSEQRHDNRIRRLILAERETLAQLEIEFKDAFPDLEKYWRDQG